jgi:hypothetical protein
MKAFLMHPDRDFDSQAANPANELALVQDLELDALFSAMARGDDFLYEVAKKGLIRFYRTFHELSSDQLVSGFV